MTPPYLKIGDAVGIAAPARKVSEEDIGKPLELLKSWGLRVKSGRHVFAEEHQFAGTDAMRLSDMQKMLDDPGINAIFIARGGYGSVRIIDKLDLREFKKHPKWLIGFSDATVFHSHIYTHTGIATIHAPMPLTFGKDKESLGLLKETLFGAGLSYTIPSHPLNRKGRAGGVLVGGNLSILYSLSGTGSDIETNGKILFIEDVDEYLYHVDRMMMQLKRSGKLERLAGMVVGSFTKMKDNKVPFGMSALDIIKDAVKEYKFPVIFGFPAGHGKQNYPLILGRKVSLNVDKKVQLRF